MIKVLNNEHKNLEEKLNKIKAQIEKTRQASDAEKRLECGSELNNIFNDFAANYLLHMNHEEETVLEASFKYIKFGCTGC